MECRRCGSQKVRKNGTSLKKEALQMQRVQKNFFDIKPKYNEETKRKEILMYLNNAWVRKTALFIGCSRTTVTNWLRKTKEKLDKMLDEFEPNYSEKSWRY